MSYAVHTKPLEALDWADLQELVDRRAEESATLEFKSVGIWDPANGRKGPQKSALPEIVAFANAYGGVLVLGIREEKGPPGVAEELQPLDDVLAKLEALQRAVGDSIDPPLQGLDWKAVMSPAGDGRGVIVARVPTSQLAPHGFGKPPEAYVRRFASSEPMTMRDLHNVFWESRTRQERVRQIRAGSDAQWRSLIAQRDNGLLERTSGARGEKIPISERGIFVRASAIFQEPLAATFSTLEALAFPGNPRNLGSDAALAFEPHGERRATVDGFLLDGRTASQWKITRDGTIDCAGFSPGRTDKNGLQNVQVPILFCLLATLMSIVAFRLKKDADRVEASFELELTFHCDTPTYCWIEHPWRHGEPVIAAPAFTVGPYLVTSRAELEATLRLVNIDIHRGFGMNVTEPQHQTFDFVASL